MKKAPNHIIRALEKALRNAKMEGFDNGSAEHTEMLKEQTRIFRESWLVPEIEKALHWAKGGSPRTDTPRRPQ